MIGKQVINNFVEYIVPLLPSLNRLCRNRRHTTEQPRWEIDYGLLNFHSNTLMDEYLELGNISIHQVRTSLSDITLSLSVQ